jgi:hypothetical protein
MDIKGQIHGLLQWKKVSGPAWSNWLPKVGQPSMGLPFAKAREKRHKIPSNFHAI